MKSTYRSFAPVGLLLAGLLAGAAAQAAPASTVANIDFTHGSTSFGYLGQQFTFTDVSSGAFDFNPVAITTGTDAKVSSLSIFGPALPSIYFDPLRGSGHLVFDASVQYSSFNKTAIQYSASPSFIGLSLSLNDGTHYGYAEFAGTTLVSYAFETSVGVGIDAAGASVAAVPEPATFAMMFGGLSLMAFVARRRRG